MIDTTFKKGNYNEWENLPNRITSKNHIIRNEIIPQIDEILKSMLGEHTNVHKNELTTEQNLDTGQLASFNLLLEYIVDDWKVPNCPEKSRQKDEETLKKVLARQDFNIESLKIDTNNGKLNIKYNIAL